MNSLSKENIFPSNTDMNFINDHIFQEIVKNSMDAIVVTDTPKIGSSEGPVIVFVNDAYETMTGYSREEVIGKSPKILQGHKTDQRELNKLRKAIKYKRPGHAKLINYKKNGKAFCTNVSIFPIEGESSGIEYWVSISRDITPEIKTQLKLTETEQHLRHIAESNSIMYYIRDKQGMLKYVSPQSREFLGYEPEEVKEHWADFVTDHPVNENEKVHRNRAITTGKAQPAFEMQLQKADGTLLWVEVKEKPVVKNGKTTEVIGCLSDLTDCRKAEQNQRLLEELTNRSWAAIWLKDSDGKYVFANQTYKSIFGLENQTVLGKTDFEILDKETALQFHENTQNTLMSGNTTEFEEQVQTPDGERYYNTHSFPLYDIIGFETLAGGFAIDITVQKKNQQIVEKSLQEKETLLMEIHHRVKNNLAIISGLLELELYEDNSKSKEEIIKNSQSRIQSMAKIHEQLYQSESFSQLSFKDYVHEMVSNIQTTIQSREFDLNFTLNVDDISLNINQAIPCGLILNEMISNSFKHAFTEQDEGNIHVSISSHHDKIILSVEDNGMGISDDFNPRETHSLGFKLIQILSDQLHADLTFGNTENGFKSSLTFEKKEDVKGSANHHL